MRILIADDDRVSAQALAHILKTAEFDVASVPDGAAALEALRQPDAPALAILDWMMPGLDGPTVCRQLRAEVTGDRYLILLTSRDAREDVVEGLEAGADDYLVKPCHRGELLARVRVGQRILSLQERLANRVEQLESALSKVKQLQGLLPICSYCKRIRSDENYWEQVDAYIVQHTDATFTHGICPACFHVLEREIDQYKAGR
jgi:DNA-binding response OmpR family regulator